MRHLILFRHGEAEQFATSDAMRDLTDAGREAVTHAVRELITTYPVVDRMIVSPFNRARQTAEIIDREYGGIGQCVSSAVTPGATPAEVVAVIEAEFSDVSVAMIVFHQPIIGRLVYYLTGQEVSVPTAGIVVIDTPIVERNCCEVKCII